MVKGTINDIESFNSWPNGFWVMDQNGQNVDWINNSRTAWPT